MSKMDHIPLSLTSNFCLMLSSRCGHANALNLGGKPS